MKLKGLAQGLTVGWIRGLGLLLLAAGTAALIAGCGAAGQGDPASAQQPGASEPLILAPDSSASASGTQGQEQGQGQEANRAPATPEGEPIVIPLSELSDQARFYPTTVNGLPVEVLAVQAADGSYRTALNTCQVCYDSGYGYYVQQGDVLVCQNCYNEFPMSAVEIESGGCNPVPIFDSLKVATADSITIPVETIEAAVPFFENWKR